MTTLKGKKIKMTQVWKDGKVEPVSVISITEGDLSNLQIGDLVKVSGITRGRGFAGVVKRHGFHGGPQTHGAKNRMRHSGSIGNTSPQRVIPGRRMAGHLGTTRCTVINLRIVEVDAEKRTVLICGAVPGYNKRSVLEIAK